MVRRITATILLCATACAALTLAWALRSPHTTDIEPAEASELHGSEAMDWMLGLPNYPYGTELPVAVNWAILDAWSQMPDEDSYEPPNGNSSSKVAYPWEFVGPSGLDRRDNSQKDSGRVRSLEYRASFGLRVGAATGGLWETEGGIHIPLTDNVSPFIGAFATDPNDDNRILIGTGEPARFTGTGIYYTTDRGANWTAATITNADPASFHDMAFAPWNDLEVHAASTDGYLRSDDGGLTWTRLKAGVCFALALEPTTAAPGKVYAAFQDDGLYMSSDAGTTWPGSPQTTAGYAGSDFFCGDLAISQSSPGTLWFLLSTNSASALTAILRTTTEGASWTDLGLPSGFSTAQANYNEAITVHPTDPDIVLVAGVQLWRTDDNGSSWSKIDDVHADHHAFEWKPDGSQLWNGNDGGVYTSTDAGQNFTTVENTYPITQLFFVSVCPTDPDVLMGGAQDVGVPVTTNGMSFEALLGADGGGIAIDPDLCSLSWSAGGLFGSPHSWRHYRSTDSFASVTHASAGIDPNTTWYPMVRSAPYSTKFYTRAGAHVYYVGDGGTTWTKLNATPFADNIFGLNIERGPSEAVYATQVTEGPSDSGRVHVYRAGSWYDGDSPDLPEGRVRFVVPHPTILGRAYAILNNVGAGNGLIFETNDWGESYTDITGSLPDLILMDVVAHPNDPFQIWVATKVGVSWTPNGGVNWFTVNTGLPVGMDVRGLELIPTGEVAGEYWLYAATFGRGAWRKRIPAPAPAGPPNYANSTATIAPGAKIMALPNATGPSLASVGATIQVQLLDVFYRPIPGVVSSRITLKASPETNLAWCPAPAWADAPTDAAGITQFSMPLGVGGATDSMVVCIDGVPIGGILTPRKLGLEVRGVDFVKDLRVDLLDYFWFDSYRNANDLRVDFDLDGDTDGDDESIVEDAMAAEANCIPSTPSFGPALASIGVYFDAAGTQTGQIVAPGGEFEFYVIAKGLPAGGLRAFELSLPFLADPAITQLTLNYAPGAPSAVDGAVGIHSYRIVLDESVPAATDLILMQGTARLNANVQSFPLCIGPVASTSFPGTGMPGWVGGSPFVEAHPFKDNFCAALNPFPGELWAGLVVEALDDATLAQVLGTLELGGLDPGIGGIGIDLIGGGGSFFKATPSGVEGAGIVFASTLPAANLPDGASLHWQFEGEGGTPLVSLSSTAAAGTMTHTPDMSGLGSPTLTLQLNNAGQNILTQPGFAGSWQDQEGIPGILAALENAGEMNIFVNWPLTTTLTLAGQNYVVDELILTSETGGAVGGGIFNRILLNANDLPAVQIASFGIQRFGQIFRSLENGYYMNWADQLEIVRLDWDLPAAVLVEELNGSPVELNFPAPDPVAEPDATVEIVFDAGEPSAFGMTLRNGSPIQLEVDVSALDANGWSARGKTGGVQQWEYSGTLQLVAELPSWPQRPTMTTDGISTTWNVPTVVTDPNGVAQPAVTELEIVPLQPFQPIPSGSQAEVRFSEMRRLTFGNQANPTATPPPARGEAELLAAQPNPFNPMTSIGMRLTSEGPVRLEIYDARGRRVRSLVDGPMPAGESFVKWDGRDQTGGELASGVYFAQLTIGAETFSTKLALVR